MATREQQIESIRKQLQSVSSGLSKMQKGIATTGITQNGKVLLPPTTPPTASTVPPTTQPATLETDWKQRYLDVLNKPYDPVAFRQTQRERLGMSGLEEKEADITGQVTEVEGLLKNLEKDINSRASSLGGVATEAQLRRRQAAEGRPLREQLGDLYRERETRQAGLTSARQELAAIMALEQSRQSDRVATLPYYKEALEEPKAQKLDTSVVEAGGRKLLIDNQTGKTIQDLGVATKSKTTKDGDEQNDINDFYDEADKLGKQLDDQNISWNDAWNRLHLRFPNASVELIDQTLTFKRRGVSEELEKRK